jgi:hypothetical protein
MEDEPRAVVLSRAPKLRVVRTPLPPQAGPRLCEPQQCAALAGCLEGKPSPPQRHRENLAGFEPRNDGPSGRLVGEGQGKLQELLSGLWRQLTHAAAGLL